MSFVLYKVTGLIRGNEYIFRVRAENKVGLGEPAESEPVRAVDPYNVPSAPGAPTIDNVMGTSCSLVWERPSSDGGAEISGKYDSCLFYFRFVVFKAERCV